jgi:hypothetical protein
MYKTCITLTGGNADNPVCIEAARAFDLIIITPYIFNKYIWNQEPELEKKCVVYFDFFVNSHYDGIGRWQRTPDELGMPELPIDWMPDDDEVNSDAFAYVIDSDRLHAFFDDIENFLTETKAAGVFLDDHRPTHIWWGMNPEDYELCHPENVEDLLKTVEWVVGRLIQYKRGDEGHLITNGNHLIPHYGTFKKSRNWETVGASFNSWSEMVEVAQEGDIFQGKINNEYNDFLTCYIGDKIGTYVNLGVPDGKKSYEYDENGDAFYNRPLPKDFPYQPTGE